MDCIRYIYIGGCLLGGVYVLCTNRMPGGVIVGDSGLCCHVPVVGVTSIVRALFLPFICCGVYYDHVDTVSINHCPVATCLFAYYLYTSDYCVGCIVWRRQWKTTSVFAVASGYYVCSQRTFLHATDRRKTVYHIGRSCWLICCA